MSSSLAAHRCLYNFSMATVSPKRESARDTLLRAAIAAIDEHGEAGVRLEEVLANAGASVSSLYHHYGNLRGLIDQAQLVRFAQAYTDSVAVFLDRLEKVSSPKDVGKLVCLTVEEVYSSERRSMRQQRLHALGAVYQNEELRHEMAELERQSAERTATAVRALQDRGFVSPAINPATWALWFNTQVYAVAVIDLLDDDAQRRAWVEHATEATLRSLGLK